MSSWVDYLVANPVIALSMVIVLILFIFMVLRKLIKWAIVSFVILALTIGVTYKDSQKPDVIDVIKELEKKKEKVIESVRKQAKEVIKRGKKETAKATEKAINKIKDNVNEKLDK
ncbi:MAG: hypothetical protein ISS81_00610 [Candidatus Marinimicrobia bacterium]|nr:hypothetical protein [Candidatus Neomarinimicrobiota bacterium]